MRVETVTVADPEVAALVRLHLAGMQSNSPPESVHALDVSRLDDPRITLFGAYLDGRLAGIGALQALGPAHGEIKSMRTRPDATRRGVARAILETIIDRAVAVGMTRLSLETGSGEAFEPALRLYRKRGFAEGGSFGGYVSSEFNQFLHLDLKATA